MNVDFTGRGKSHYKNVSLSIYWSDGVVEKHKTWRLVENKVLLCSPGPLKITKQGRPPQEKDTEVACKHVEQKQDLQILVLLTAFRRPCLPLT